MECIIFQHVKSPEIKTAQLRRVVFSVLKQAKKEANINLHLIGDRRMKNLNHRYRGRDQTTDVLAFATDVGIASRQSSDLGDIFVSIPQVRRQAKAFSVTYTDEFYRMIIHGILHLLGYNHEKKGEAKIMFKAQEKYLKRAI